MSRSKLGKTILLATVIMVWPGGSVFGRAIECEIIQFKLNRFYFAAGTELDIFDGNLFEVIYNDSTIYQGRIESALLGVCFSEPTGLTFDSLLLDSCTGLLELPDVDSTSEIRLYCLAMNPALLRLETEGAIDSGNNLTRHDYLTSVRGNPTTFKRIEELDLLVETDPMDGLFSFVSPGILQPPQRAGRTQSNVQSSPAPFFAALIPNLSVMANEGGLLTTSLYYRFSDNNLGRIFAGDSIESFPCGFPTDSGCPRPYPYHPLTGRAVLSNFDHRPVSIRVGVADASLAMVADYFADVLSRDRIRVEFVTDPNETDLWLEFISMRDSNPESSLQEMMEIATGDRKPIKQMSESIDLVAQRIASAANSESREAAYYFCELADRAMKEDLGIFPLFRPRLFFTTDRMLKNARFDSGGYFLYEELKLLALPKSPKEEIE